MTVVGLQSTGVKYNQMEFSVMTDGIPDTINLSNNAVRDSPRPTSANLGLDIFLLLIGLKGVAIGNETARFHF